MPTWKNILTASDDKESAILGRHSAKISFDGPGTAGNYKWCALSFSYGGGDYAQNTVRYSNDRYEYLTLYPIYYPKFIAPYDLKISEGCKIHVKFRVTTDGSNRFSGGKFLHMFYRPSDTDWDAGWKSTGYSDHSPGGTVTYIDSPPIDVDLGGPANGIMSYQMPTGTNTEMSDGDYGMEYTLTAGQEIIIKRGYPMYLSSRIDGSSSSTGYGYIYNWVTIVECYRI